MRPSASVSFLFSVFTSGSQGDICRAAWRARHFKKQSSLTFSTFFIALREFLVFHRALQTENRAPGRANKSYRLCRRL
jgi:hypothetical protein